MFQLKKKTYQKCHIAHFLPRSCQNTFCLRAALQRALSRSARIFGHLVYENKCLLSYLLTELRKILVR